MSAAAPVSPITSTHALCFKAKPSSSSAFGFTWTVEASRGTPPVRESVSLSGLQKTCLVALGFFAALFTFGLAMSSVRDLRDRWMESRVALARQAVALRLPPAIISELSVYQAMARQLSPPVSDADVASHIAKVEDRVTRRAEAFGKMSEADKKKFLENRGLNFTAALGQGGSHIGFEGLDTPEGQVTYIRASLMTFGLGLIGVDKLKAAAVQLTRTETDAAGVIQYRSATDMQWWKAIAIVEALKGERDTPENQSFAKILHAAAAVGREDMVSLLIRDDYLDERCRYDLAASAARANGFRDLALDLEAKAPAAPRVVVVPLPKGASSVSVFSPRGGAAAGEDVNDGGDDGAGDAAVGGCCGGCG